MSYLSGTTAAVYTYHPDNLRKTKTVNGATTNFVWADGNLVHEYTNTSTKTYFYAIILVSDSAGQAYLYNTHGDVIKLIGTLTWSNAYDAYGVQQNPDPLDGNAFRYAGQYFDTESGTYYLRARYYNPNTGRFTQPDQHWNISNSLFGDDPLKLNGYTIPSIAAVMQSTNRYGYCMGNPVNYADQYGEFVWPGEIHNKVVEHIYNLDTQYFYKEQIIDYKGGGYGRADIIGADGQVWEIKSGNPLFKERNIRRGEKQLNKYINEGTWRYDSTQALKADCDIPEMTGEFSCEIGDHAYNIQYQYERNGIVTYTYEEVKRSKSYSEVTNLVGNAVLTLMIIGLIAASGGALAPELVPYLP